jgi:hypothetical protein
MDSTGYSFHNKYKIFSLTGHNIMRYLAVIFLTCFVVAGCGKKEKSTFSASEPKHLHTFSAYGSEAFAYSLDSGWEVNGITRLKGFKQTENDNKFYASFSYTVDVVTPKNDTLKSVASKMIDKTNDEKMTDVEIETQFDLDSTYKNGEYKIIFNVKDQNTDQKASSSTSFKLD